MLLSMYLAGLFVTAIGVLAAATKVRGRNEVRLRSVGFVALVAGLVWPVLVIGVVQLLAISALAKMCAVGAGLPQLDDKLENITSKYTQTSSASYAPGPNRPRFTHRHDVEPTRATL
jgi:ABC-type spermidine/putrescine transport system permease subunit II